MPALRDVPKCRHIRNVPKCRLLNGAPKLSNNLFKNTNEHRRVYTRAQQ